MKVYQDLVIRGGRLGPSEFIEQLERRLRGGWTRNLALEGRTNSGIPPMYCFTRLERGKRFSAHLWLAARSNGEMYVCNILAEARREITAAQYNKILQNFHKLVVRPAAAASGAEVELGNPDPGIEDFLSPETCDLLRWFSRAANVASLHPSDREMWNEFVSAAYREGGRLDPEMLGRWLVEEEKWPQEAAFQRVLEYEGGLELLAVFNRPIRPKAKAAGRE